MSVRSRQWRILVLAGGAMAPYGCGGPGAAGAGGGGGPGVGGAEGEEKGGKEEGGRKGDKRGTFPQSFDLFTSSKHIFQGCRQGVGRGRVRSPDPPKSGEGRGPGGPVRRQEERGA